MKDLAGKAAIVTGASRGLGVYIARALAAAGMDLVIAARTAAALDDLKAQLEGGGRKIIAVPTDLGQRAAREALVAAATAALGPVDVLVNNAGIEFTVAYHKLRPEEIDDAITVNLAAAMHLARLVLPDMLARGRGHIVNLSSLAGKAGPAYSEPYAATKAALIGFTQSLRASYAGTGVSASVICPGFVEEGMYARAKAEVGLAAPKALGVSTPQAVADAVVRAIRDDLPEVIVNPRPVRPLLALAALAPGLAEKLARLIGVNEIFRKGAEFREREREGQD